MSLILYHAVPSRSAIARWMLEEVGEPYEIKLLRLQEGEQDAPDYLKINPMGKVPALDHDGTVVTEAAAICAYLADAFPKAGLTVPIGDPRRGPYLKWLFFGPGVIEPAVTDHAFKRVETPPRGTLGYGDYDTVMNVVEAALAPGPYLFGEAFTAADVVVGSMLRWGLAFELLPKREAFVAYVGRLTERSASKRADQKDEGLQAA